MHAASMSSLTVRRVMAAVVVVAGLTACAGTQPGSQTTPASGTTAVRTSAPPAVSPSARPSPHPPATSAPPVTSPPPAVTSPAAPTRSAEVPATSPAPGEHPVTGALAGKDWTVIPTSRRVVALTFDAGANADAVPSILASLRRAGVPATFFLTGNFVRDFPAAARSIAAGGFRIGDHTISHPY